MSASSDIATRVFPAALSARFRPRLGVPSLYTAATIAILGAVLLVALAPKLDTDLWWHLKAGQFIAQHHQVPRADYLSFTFAGRAWTDHEWLSELLLYGLYGVAGLWGTIVGFALIIWGAYVLVYTQMRARGAHTILALFLLTLAFIASSPTWAARPQMITLLFLALFSLLLMRFGQSRDRRLLVAFPLCMLLWTNLHGGWVLGLVLMAVVLVGECVNRLTSHPEAWDRADLQGLAICLLASLAATVVNPNGLSEVLYPLVWVVPSDYTNVLSEWVSPDFHMLQMMFFEALLLLLVGAVYLARARLNWAHLLLVLVFTHLALAEGRNVAVWTVVITPLLAQYLQASGPRVREMFPRMSYRRRPVEGRIGGVLNVILLALVTLAYAAEGIHFINGTALQQAEKTNFPSAAVQYLQQHRVPGHVFNSYAWGGYLLWYSYPRYRDFIDGRANTLYDSKILHDYMAASSGSPRWDDVLRRYGVNAVLIERSSPLATVLSHDQHWQLLHRDAVAVIFERT